MATLVSGLGGSAGFGEQSMKSVGVTSGNLDDGSRFVDTSSVFGASGINIGGTTYSGFYLNTNGNLTFGSPNSNYNAPSNSMLADAPGQPMIAAFWTDIDINKGGDILWDLDAASGKVTITWSNVAPFSSSGANSFQIVLTGQGSGNVGVDFIYGNIGFTAGGGTQATVGISNGSTQILAEGSGNAGFLSTYGNNNFDTGDPNGVFGADLQGGTPTVSINGTAGHDTLNGTAGSDLVYGGAGNDSINGGGGNDTLNGDAGNDTLNAGTGNDSLSGGDGDDRFVLANGFGNDTIVGGEAGETTGDVLDASAITANTTITFSANEAGMITDGTSTATFSQIENITTGSGNNTVNAGATTSGVNVDAGAGNDTMTGGSGADTLLGGSGNDSLSGGAGNDRLDGGSGNDALSGGSGNDTLSGGTGNDSLTGGDGDDRFVLDNTSGNDTITGGEGSETSGDTLDGSAISAAVTVNLSGNEAGTANAGGATVTFSQVENFVSGGGDDSFNAASASSGITIDAGGGADTIIGSAGADRIYGGTGADSIGGGSGNDTIDAGSGNDVVAGGDGADSIHGGGGGDILSGGTGQDILTGGAGADRFVLVEADSGDVVTDFDLTLDNGRTLDQLDVSDLVDGNGNPIRAWQIQIADDGSGGSVLTFPGGESLTLQGVSSAGLQTAGTLFSMGVPCFASGMMIDCPDGPRPVEDLRPGDLVLAEKHQALPVVWVGKAKLNRDDLDRRPDLKPVFFAAGSAGNHADVLLSPQHAVALPGQDVLIRARHLVGLVPGVRVARGRTSVSYHHILLDRHAVLSCHGLRCESLYPGPMTERMFPIAHRLELTRAITALAGTAVVPAGGLAALYGPRCLPLLGRIKGDSMAPALAIAVDCARKAI